MNRLNDDYKFNKCMMTLEEIIAYMVIYGNKLLKIENLDLVWIGLKMKNWLAQYKSKEWRDDDDGQATVVPPIYYISK